MSYVVAIYLKDIPNLTELEAELAKRGFTGYTLRGRAAMPLQEYLKSDQVESTLWNQLHADADMEYMAGRNHECPASSVEEFFRQIDELLEFLG